MTWRELVYKEEWSKINPYKFSQPDLNELFEILAKVVPTIKRGDGLQWYTDFARSDECCGKELQAAASLFEQVRGVLAFNDQSHPEFSHPFRYQFELIDYIFRWKGFPNGRPHWVYWSHKSEMWKPLTQEFFARLERAKMAAAIEAEGNGEKDEIIDAEWVKRDMARRRLRPWRYPWSTNRFINYYHQPNSLIWLADVLYERIETLQFGIEDVSAPNVKRLERKFNAYRLAEGAIDIGKITEAIEWKLGHERAALETYDRKEKSKVGAGLASQGKKTQRIEAMLSAMETIARDNSATHRFKPEAVAKLAIEDAVKSDPELWSQGRGQLDNYLSEIRTNLDLRGRYYKIFPKTA